MTRHWLFAPTLVLSLALSLTMLDGLAPAAHAAAEGLGGSDSPAQHTLLEIRKNADAGDAEAQYALGLLYVTGEGVPKSREQARNWLRRAAEQGDPRAQNCLGLLLDPLWYGAAKAEHAHEAAQWYKRAAQQGFAPALHNLQEMKDRKLIADDIPDAVPLARPALVRTSSPAFAGEADIPEEGKDARAVFAENAAATAEILGDGNYGSGVLIGTLSRKEGYLLQRGAGDREKPVPYAFFSRSRKEPVTLEGRYSAVLTNRHVIQGNVQVRVGLGSNENGETTARYVMAGVCLADDANLDLALLFVPHGAGTADALAALRPVTPFEDAKPPAKGSIVYALGNPEKLPRTIAQGLFNGVRPEGFQFDAPISKGSSGGALLDAQGRLLGLIVGFAAAEGSQNLNFAIPYDRLAKFLGGEGMHCFVP